MRSVRAITVPIICGLSAAVLLTTAGVAAATPPTMTHDGTALMTHDVMTHDVMTHD
jgi:hypothetical protein